MKSEIGKVLVRNVPNGAQRYIVARLVDSELWYYGGWESENEADRFAKRFENGVSVDLGEEHEEYDR